MSMLDKAASARDPAPVETESTDLAETRSNRIADPQRTMAAPALADIAGREERAAAVTTIDAVVLESAELNDADLVAASKINPAAKSRRHEDRPTATISAAASAGHPYAANGPIGALDESERRESVSGDGTTRQRNDELTNSIAEFAANTHQETIDNAIAAHRDKPISAVDDDDSRATIPSFARAKVAPNPAHTATAATRPADASPRSTAIIEWLIARVPHRFADRIRDYLVLMRLDRPVGALLLLWPTWWALWFAAGDFPPVATLVIFTLGVLLMRSAGCVINDYADHDWLDDRVERTRARPMAAGRVSRGEALRLFGGLLALAFVLVCFTNRLTIELSFIGAALAAIYPFSKRVTHLAQVVLGAAFGWSIPMAFAAVTNSLPPLAWLLFLGNVLFSTIYDTEYAMVDRDDDLRAGAKSTAILFGDADRAIIGVLMATFALAMALAGTRAALGWPYFTALAVACALFVWQLATIRDRSREHCFAAFRNNNWVGLVIWVGLLLAVAIR